jgi:hypothetical protein
MFTSHFSFSGSLMALSICGRNVFCRRGTKTQTVNICTEENVRNSYDYIVRLQQPFIIEDELKKHNFESIDAFVHYLVEERHGCIERMPDSKKGQQDGEKAENTKDYGSSRIEEAITIVEQSINQLVQDFIQFPYLHRVEHSLHCELFRLLSNQRLFMTKLPIDGWLSQPIHKEWPEWMPRPEKGNIRGNFDFAIILPEDFNTCLLKDYRNGRIKPPIVIEIGLDYGIDHLKGDANKIINSNIIQGYLVHLLRDEKVSDLESLEDFLLTAERDHSSLKTAYAGVTKALVAYKLIGDTIITKKIKRE